MSYTKHNFAPGDKLYASQLNEMEDQIATNEENVVNFTEGLPDIVDDWLDENFSNPDSPPLDRSLSSSSSAAPADVVGDELSDLKSAISNECIFPELRNGTIGNLGNLNGVALENIQKYNDATAIKIVINRPLDVTADHYILVFSTYTINDAPTGDNGAYRVTSDQFINLVGNSLYIKKGYFDATSIGFAFHILERDQSDNAIPLRTTDFSSGDVVIIYDYSNSDFYTSKSDGQSLRSDVLELRDDIDEIYRNMFISGSPSTTSEIDLDIAIGDKYKIINNTSGKITPQIYNGATQVKILPQIDSGRSLYFTADVAGDSLKTYCNSSVVNGETFELIWEDTVVEELAQNVQKTYYCNKDGSGDFTSLVDAINTATQFMDSVVYVGPGEWYVLTELGNDFLNNVSSDPSTWGLILKNRIHLIFASNSKVIANYTGNVENVNKYFSVFNTGEYGFILENCTIETKDIRYCVHDDPGLTTPYHNKYINCKMYHDNSANPNFNGWGCIGGGFGKDSYIEIIGCEFDAKNKYGDAGGVVSYHNSYMSGAKSRLLIKDCYCKGQYTFRLSWHGTSTEKSTAYITNCRIGASIIHSGETESDTIESCNTELIEWNNLIVT